MDRPGRTAVVALLIAVLGVLLLGVAGPVPLPILGDCPTGPVESAPPAATTITTTTATAEPAAAGTTTATTTTTTTTTATPTTSATPDDGYDRTRVIAYDANGSRLGAVTVRVAETSRQKFTGLSETESLAEDEGMLFPYGSEGEHTYVMRGMEFGIDIVYVDAEGYVTRIHHAPEPPPDVNGENCRYPGRGQYVLEVRYNWTVRHGVDVGDRLYIEGYEEWPRNDSVAPASG